MIWFFCGDKNVFKLYKVLCGIQGYKIAKSVVYHLFSGYQSQKLESWSKAWIEDNAF